MQQIVAHPPEIDAPATPDAPLGASGGSGLVLSSTTDTLLIDRQKSRLWRMKRSIVGAAALIQEQLQQGGHRYKALMITATYAKPDDWAPEHVSGLLKSVREWMRRRGLTWQYVWTAEIQESRLERSGAAVVHYHLVLWIPKGITLPKPDKRGWWPHGMTRIEWARKPVRYITKYASKADQGAKFPKGLRLHGNGGLKGSYKGWHRWHLAPLWARSRYDETMRLRRATGGGWLAYHVGGCTFHPPEWGLMAMGQGGVRLRKLHPDEWPPQREKTSVNWPELAAMVREAWWEDERRIISGLQRLKETGDVGAYLTKLESVMAGKKVSFEA